MSEDILNTISKRTGLSKADCSKVAEELLSELHKRFFEADSDYIGERAPFELSDRAFYHFLGMLEQFSEKYGWDKGSISQYLGRMPPVERWKELSKEMDGWENRR